MDSWSWQYTAKNPDKSLMCTGINKTVEKDGSINANMVITGIPDSYYELVLTVNGKKENGCIRCVDYVLDFSCKSCFYQWLSEVQSCG